MWEWGYQTDKKIIIKLNCSLISISFHFFWEREDIILNFLELEIILSEQNLNISEILMISNWTHKLLLKTIISPLPLKIINYHLRTMEKSEKRVTWFKDKIVSKKHHELKILFLLEWLFSLSSTQKHKDMNIVPFFF